MGDWNEQPFVLLLRVTQSNGKPLPIGGFTGRAMSHQSLGHKPVQCSSKSTYIFWTGTSTKYRSCRGSPQRGSGYG